MRENILGNFKHDLRIALESFEKESGGRHNRRPEISGAISAIEEYINHAQNPLVLLNMIEVYIKNFLTGFLKSFFFRDEYQLKKNLFTVLARPEYCLHALSHSFCHESEIEKLALYKLIAQLEERLKSVESGNEDREVQVCRTVGQSEFDDLRAKIAYLEECEKQALIKISDLENEKWIDKREIIALRDKIEFLSTENTKLQERNEAQEAELKKLRAEAQRPRPPESLAKNPQLIYKALSTETPQEPTPKTTCRVF